jgi:hypothetical protein
VEEVGTLTALRVAPEKEEHDDELEGLAIYGNITIGGRGGEI